MYKTEKTHQVKLPPTITFNYDINLFSSNVPYLYPPKMSQNERFFDVFRGYRNGKLGQNELLQFAFVAHY